MKQPKIVRTMAVLAVCSALGLVVLSVGLSPKAPYPLMVTQTTVSTQADVNEQTLKEAKKIFTQQSVSKNTQYDFPMNINDANKQALMQVKGIGEKRSQDILDYLQQKGKIHDMEQLREIKGIGDVTMERLCEKFYAE